MILPMKNAASSMNEARPRRRWTALLLSLLLLPGLAPAASVGDIDVPDPARLKGLPQPLPQPVRLSFCIFDPLGPQGKIIQTARDLAKFAEDWNLFADIRPYSDERVAAEDFKAGQCDVVAISTLRAKQFNFTIGSIDAPGNLRNYAEMKTFLQMVSNPVVASLAVNGRYQIAAVVPIGSIFVYVNDRQINSLAKAAGKRVVVLDWEPNMAKLISGIGAQPVLADFSTYAGKFNNGQADIIAAPAMGWKPMELAKGVGSKGGVIRFPLLQATAAVVIRRDKILPRIPDLDSRLNQLRKFGLQYIDGLFNMLKAAEADIPRNLWIDLPQADQDKYYQMLAEARKVLTRNGVYDPVMMSLLKRARCKNVPSAAECGNFDE